MKPFIIGYTSGVFDLFHVGHVNILRRAKELCDFLIVGVTTDEVVEQYKGKKPIINFNDRKTIVESCKYADKVVAQSSMNKMDAWHYLHFNVMFHGKEWKGTELYNTYEQELGKVGVDIIYLEPTKGISTTKLIEKLSHLNNDNNS